MATTPIYGFETPDDTDLVKDGALAIRTALDDVDTTLGTALNSNDYAGLVLVKKQTIGSGVSSVTVTDAFSATYENYKIIISGGNGSTEENGFFKLGASTTNYYGSLVYTTPSSNTVLGASDNNAVQFGYAWKATSTGLAAQIELNAPFLAEPTIISGVWAGLSANGRYTGYHSPATSYTSFIVNLGGGATMTGGTIYVYGYGIS
jgi:hypothetical protein